MDLGRVVDDDKDAADLERGKNPHDQLGAVRQVEDDALPSLDTTVPEGAGQPVGLCLDLGVGQALSITDEGNLVRGALGAPLQEFLYQHQALAAAEDLRRM